MHAFAQLQDYLALHFVDLAALAGLSGLPAARLESLIAAEALPRPSYVLWPNGAWSSPIGGAHGPTPHGTASSFYSPAAAWWARRASFLPGSPQDIAKAFREEFVSDFVTRLRHEPSGSLGYPHAYDERGFDPQLAQSAAFAEWRDWIDGGYGVCLRYWDAHHAITKTCQRALVVSLTRDGATEALDPETLDRVLVAMQRLEAVMLPFAPYQRPHGTPGLWIDRILVRLGLGQAHRAEPARPQAPK